MSQPTAHFRTPDGLEVRLRPLGPDDGSALVTLFGHLGPQSRLRRFNRDLANAEAEAVQREAQRLASEANEGGAAWLAEADLPGELCAPIAVVRYHRIPPTSAEVAVVVRDALQGQGIGRRLLRFIAEQAQQAGIVTLTGLVRHDNAPVHTLLGRAPYPTRRTARGEYDVYEVALGKE